jgi:hypothetical protein
MTATIGEVRGTSETIYKAQWGKEELVGHKNDTKNERSSGRCGGILFLATRRLDFGL